MFWILDVIPDPNFSSRIPYPGSKRHQIPDPDPQNVLYAASGIFYDPRQVHVRVFMVIIVASEHLKRVTVTGMIFKIRKIFHSSILQVKSLKLNITTASYSQILKTISAQTKITRY